MNSFSNKLKLIFVPFLLIAVSIIVGYTLLNWVLFINLHAFSLKEDIVNVGIPFCLPWIPVFLLLRPRIKLLNLKRKKGDLPFLYIFVACFAIIIPTLIAQGWLETASGKLSRLDNINQVENHQPSKYYTLKNFYIDKSHIGVQSSFDVSGKHNEYLDMKLYVALPIWAKAEDTANANCLAWYGIRYQKQISNRLSENEKEQRYHQFAIESQADFENKDVNQFIYFDRIGNTDDHQGYISAIRNNKAVLSNSTIVFVPVNAPFESRNGNKLPWTFASLAIGALVWLMMIGFAKWDETSREKFESGIIEKSVDEKETLKLFVPHEGFYITPIIMYLNTLVFLLMVFSGLGFLSFSTVDLLTWGANFRPSTAGGEWWRLVTSIFLHGGIMHLVANMYGLLFVGIFLEPVLGKTKYAVAYLVTGILASITSLWWHQATVSVGASGAIFGLYGVFLALLLAKVFPKDFSKGFLASTLIFVAYNLVMGLSGGIDNAAHLGGLLSGFILGWILSVQLKRDAAYEQFVLEAQKERINEELKV